MAIDDHAWVFVVHGSRHLDASAAAVKLFQRWRVLHKRAFTTLAFLQLQQPSLEQALILAAKQVKEVRVLPFFMQEGEHTVNDIPHAIEEAKKNNPDTNFVTLPFFGCSPLLHNLIHKRLNKINGHPSVVIVGHESTNNELMHKLAKGIQRTTGLKDVRIATIAGKKGLKTILLNAHEHNVYKFILLPWLLLPGTKMDEIKRIKRTFIRQFDNVDIEILPPLYGMNGLPVIIEKHINQINAEYIESK
ncbi:MAG: CbiX/SirB N-terminal domain-containing protein [Mariprofundales bacterium]